MKRSQNEVFGMAVKAARGAGYPPGIADELAQATLWLCQKDCAGVEALVEDLGYPHKLVAFKKTGREMRLSDAPTGTLAISAVDALAAKLCDRAIVARAPNSLMVLGACGVATRELGFAVNISGWAIIDRGEIVSLSGEIPAGDLAISLIPSKDNSTDMPAKPIEVADQTWTALEALAAKTYVPASEASREKGAGAGLTDND